MRWSNKESDIYCRTMEGEKKYNTGLILSGGAARGFAHAGILKALHEWRIEPEIISGVSAGSIVGAFYADGFSPEEILEIFDRKRLFRFVRICAPGSGFLEMSGLKDSLKRNLRHYTFKELKKPLWITVTNYRSGQPEYIHQGDVIDAVIASSSIPVLFRPQKINGNFYIDGGITNNFPVEPIVKDCNRLIGAYVNPVGNISKPKGVFHTALRSFQLSISSRIIEKKKKMTIFIEPVKLAGYGLFEVARGKEMFEIGYEAAVEVLKKYT
ncbi:MAG: patatin-like phospholipase family protein [Bacteroidota bacterium]